MSILFMSSIFERKEKKFEASISRSLIDLNEESINQVELGVIA